MSVAGNVFDSSIYFFKYLLRYKIRLYLAKKKGRLAEKKDPEGLKIWANVWVIERLKQFLSRLLDCGKNSLKKLLFGCDCCFLSLSEIK